MNSQDNRSKDADDLRRRAAAIAHERVAPSAETLMSLSPEETQQMLHELRVHQIELEMRNEELNRVQAVLDAARARSFDLYDRRSGIAPSASRG
jgi:hypothetical protein